MVRRKRVIRWALDLAGFAASLFLSHNTAMVIDGKKIAESILERLKAKAKPEKFFAAVLVGNDPASASFLRLKGSVAKTLGIDFRLYEFAMEMTKDALRAEVLKIAQHQTCGGILIQLPLPNGLDAQYVVNVIPPSKDIDVMSERALGAFYVGRGAVLPPSVGVVAEILESRGLEAGSLCVAVVGAGFLIGRPVASWLMGRAKEVIVLDQGSDFSLLKNADVVVCGAGVPDVVKPAMLKADALVIDFGYGMKDGKASGDFDGAGIEDFNKISYTPTPGGTGPILVAKLFENFYKVSEG